MVEIIGQARPYPQAAKLEAALRALMDERGAAHREVTVVLTSDEHLRELNRNYRGIDAPTDVLSFPSHEPGEDDVPDVPHLGDIFISLETAMQQAGEHDLSPEQEVSVLAAHGFMHLLGYDHRTEEEWRVFTKAQGRVLELLELG